MKKPIAVLALSVTMLGGWYVNCDPFDQLPIRSWKGTVFGMACTGEYEPHVVESFFRARRCADEMGLWTIGWGSYNVDLQVCIVESPFACPGLHGQGNVAECAGVVEGGAVWAIVSKTWTEDGYDLRSHVTLGVTNLLVWMGYINLPMPESELRESEMYWELLECAINEEVADANQ